jgi:predicted DNA-binding transcriptional regulator YafY
VETINLAGIPVVTYQGSNGGIGLAEGYRFDKSVLTFDDMAAIITTLKGVSGTLTESNQHDILMEKFKNALSASQLQKLDTKVNQMVIDLSPWGRQAQQKEKVAIIRQAIEDRKWVEFEYTDGTGVTTNRKVESYTILLKGQKWYLYAWCPLRQEFRFFKLSRMKKLILLEDAFSQREVNIDSLLTGNWNSTENLIEVELLFEKEMQNVLDEWEGVCPIPLEDGRLMVKVLLPDTYWLDGFFLSFGTRVEVLSPPSLRERLAVIAREIYKKYS